jgi:hypothetical protein
MEKVRKIVEKLKSFYQKYLKCRNEHRLDKNFHALLQILCWFGFYQPSPTNTRIAYGVVMFLFVFVTHLINALNGAATEWQEGNLNQALINVMGFCFAASLATLVLSFVQNQKGFIDMIRELNGMHEYDHEEAVNALRKINVKIVKIYKAFLLSLISVGIVAYFLDVFFNLIPLKLLNFCGFFYSYGRSDCSCRVLLRLALECRSIEFMRKIKILYPHFLCLSWTLLKSLNTIKQ